MNLFLFKELIVNGSPEDSKNNSHTKGLASLASKFNAKPKSPTELIDKSRANNELFGLNKQKSTAQLTKKANKPPLDKKPGLFNLSNGLSSYKKSTFGSLKDKKLLNGPGLIQQNAPSISVAGRSKIS